MNNSVNISGPKDLGACVDKQARYTPAAALMEEMQQMFGQAWVDAALREGQGAADTWLASQRSPGPVLRIAEGDVAVGALPGNRPAGLGAEKKHPPRGGAFTGRLH